MIQIAADIQRFPLMPFWSRKRSLKPTILSFIIENGYDIIWIFVINTISTHQTKKIVHILVKNCKKNISAKDSRSQDSGARII
ncbi:MAG: hypothetical protein SV062_07800 [Thermodesulfobacteriota bacterium]|nr:hypothetical protein [Thermodesulfobacteriota bacterium]